MFETLARVRYCTILRKYSSPSYIHNVGSEPLRYQTVGNILEQKAKQYGDRLAIVSRDQTQSLSFQEVLNRADRLAAGFQAIGLNAGDRIGIWAPNSIEWYLTHMACARGGFVLVNINSSFQPQDMEFCVNSVGVKAIVGLAKSKKHNYYENLITYLPEIYTSKPGKLNSSRMPTLQSIIMSGSENLRGVLNFDEVLELASEADIKNISKLQNLIKPDSVCHLQFTSGTTGRPKAPMQSHFQIVNNSYFVSKRNELHKKHHIVCVQVPFFHVFGTIAAINGGLHQGATLVLPGYDYNPDKSLDAIRDEKCTISFGTPTMYVDLVNKQKLRKENINLEIAVNGGALCSPQLFKDMKEVMGTKKVKSIYGLTETTASCYQSLHDDDEYKATSTVGFPQDHYEVKVVDEKGFVVPRGTPGELCLRSYATTLGYWNNEEKTKELIGDDKWMKTGDQFVIEEDGYGKVVGRLKDMIIRGGENIYPSEIEHVLNEHALILECHVVGTPHERLGEEVCACVRVQANEEITLEEVKKYCKGKMAHFKIPSRLQIVQSFPKTGSGKIQKFKLVEDIVGNK